MCQSLWRPEVNSGPGSSKPFTSLIDTRSFDNGLNFLNYKPGPKKCCPLEELTWSWCLFIAMKTLRQTLSPTGWCPEIGCVSYWVELEHRRP